VRTGIAVDTDTLNPILYFTKKTANNNKALLAVCISTSRQRY